MKQYTSQFQLLFYRIYLRHYHPPLSPPLTGTTPDGVSSQHLRSWVDVCLERFKVRGVLQLYSQPQYEILMLSSFPIYSLIVHSSSLKCIDSIKILREAY